MFRIWIIQSRFTALQIIITRNYKKNPGTRSRILVLNPHQPVIDLEHCVITPYLCALLRICVRSSLGLNADPDSVSFTIRLYVEPLNTKNTGSTLLTVVEQGEMLGIYLNLKTSRFGSGSGTETGFRGRAGSDPKHCHRVLNL